ncbi:MAG: monovalent cation/H+ antiporter subunit D family protein [Bacillota bacterium]
MTHIPILAVVLSLIGAFVSPVLAKYRPRAVGHLARGLVAFNLIQLVRLLLFVNATGTFQYHVGDWPPPWGIALSVDYLALFMALVIHGLSILVLLYARADLKREVAEASEPWYYTLFLLLIASMTGLSFANDFFNVFVFMEICTISACAIISIKSNRDCVEASLKYLILSIIGSGMVLFSVALVYMVTGHLNFDYIAAALPEAVRIFPLNIMVSLALLTVGLGIKAALFPLHVWLPDAHSSAPTPSSAILSGVVIKVYAVVLMRLIYTVYGLEIFRMIPIVQVVLAMATIAIFAGSLFAIAQEDVKRMLAYSSVAQIGYVFLGVALLTENAVSGGILHIFNHAVMKSMLFLAAGAIIYRTGVRRIDEFAGMGQRMPLTMAVFSIGALAMVGVPGFNGFVSKYYLVIGALDAAQPFYAAVILMSSMLNAVYYLPIIITAFFSPGEHVGFERDRLPLAMTIPMVFLGAACIYSGVLPGRMLNLVGRATAALLGVH